MNIRTVNPVAQADLLSTIAAFEYPSNPQNAPVLRAAPPKQADLKVNVFIDWAIKENGFHAEVKYAQVYDYVTNQYEVDNDGADPVNAEGLHVFLRETTFFSKDQAQGIYAQLSLSVLDAASGGHIIDDNAKIVREATKWRLAVYKSYFGLTAVTDFENV